MAPEGPVTPTTAPLAPRRLSRVVVVGLGPAGPELLTAAARTEIERLPHRFLRTTRHPAAVAVPEATSFDARYEAEATMDAVYRGIVDDLVAAAEEHGEVLYAVPGSPTVAERTVELLRADDRVEVDVLPSVSFLDLAWDRLGVDPVAAGVRLVDGHDFAVAAAGTTGPLLVGQCDRPSVLSDIKLSVEEGPTGHRPAAPRPARRVGDRGGVGGPGPVVEPDHLTSLWIPGLAEPVAAELERFAELVRRLRAECPWDREQTHQSLTRHLVEESYEVLDAIDLLAVDEDEGYVALEEELGDLLFQVVFHATLGAEEGRFTLADVARGDPRQARAPPPSRLRRRRGRRGRRRRHATGSRSRRPRRAASSVFDGIPDGPAGAALRPKVQKKAEATGLAEAVPPPRRATSVGDALLALVSAARAAGLDPEDALRRTAMAVAPTRFVPRNPRADRLELLRGTRATPATGATRT